MAAIGFEDSTEVRELARRHVTGNNALQATASLVAMGELASRMAEMDEQGLGYDSSKRRLRKYIQEGSLTISWVQDYEDDIQDPYSLAQQARGLDNRLDPTDSLVIGSALADPRATLLYSTDNYIQRVPLRRFCNEHGTKLSGP